jgi:tetratricopeptide (TPR) repeat protein
MEDAFYGGIFLVIVLVQLWKGRIFGLDSGYNYSRAGRPFRYWLVIAAELGAALFLFSSATFESWEAPAQASQSRVTMLDDPTAVPATPAPRATQPAPSGPVVAVVAPPEPNWSGRGAKAGELIRAEQHAEALKLYDELLLETETDADLHYGRGVAHWKLGHTDAALADFRRTLELQPRHYHAVLSADRMLEPLARWSEILEMWDRYIAVEPGIASAYQERGGTHSRMRNMKGAAADMTKACELGLTGWCGLAAQLRANAPP